MNAIVRHVAGWSLLALGLAGLVLPILQGWLFIALGSLLLARDLPLFARLVCWVEERIPWVRHPLERLRQRGEGRYAPPPCPPPGSADPDSNSSG